MGFYQVCTFYGILKDKGYNIGILYYVNEVSR